MAVSAGGVATVRVTVATLWSSPGAVRPADEAALGPDPDIAAWVEGLSPTSGSTPASCPSCRSASR